MRLAELKGLLLWILLFVGVVAREGALALFSAALLLFDYVASRWTKWNMRAVTCRKVLSRQQVWPGETVTLTLEIENRSFIPVSLLETYDEIADIFHVHGGVLKASSNHGRKYLHNVFRLGFWERVRRHYKVDCPQRGKYLFGPTEFAVTDPFGFITDRGTVTDTTTLLVYPRVYALEELDVRPRALLGDLSLKSFIHEDPLRFVGTREYRPGDPLNRINWKATARARKHMVHLYEPSANVCVQFVLSLTTSDHAWQGVHLEEAEWAISVTASIGLSAINSGLSVGVIASDFITDLPVGAGEEQAANLLEALAATNAYSLWRPRRFLENALEQRTFGTTLVFVTPHLSEETVAVIAEAQTRGIPLRVVYTGSEPSEFQVSYGMLWIRKGGAASGEQSS